MGRMSRNCDKRYGTTLRIQTGTVNTIQSRQDDALERFEIGESFHSVCHNARHPAIFGIPR